jgi:hypothetical protein
MKTLILTTALAAVVATPLMAQTAGPSARRAPSQALIQSDAWAFAPNGRTETQRRVAQPNAVYEGDTYVGADPDPNVRLNLRMDYQHRDF